MDGDFKGKLIRQALWFLRKGLEILERLFGHPPDESTSDAKPDSSGEPLILKPSSDDEQPPQSAGLPYYNVGAGVFPTNHLSNGKEKRQLQRAERLILASLLTNRSIGVMHVIAFHTSSGLGTISDHKRNAGTKISLIKAALRESGATIKKKEEGCWGCYQWILVRDEPKKTEFSVDAAYDIALNAQNELDGGNYLKAMELAIHAIDTDRIVQLAHEVFCLAALEINPADQVNMDRIRVSYWFLANRIEQIGRGRQIAASSLVHADDENLRNHLLDSEASFATEHTRVSGIQTRLKARFGTVHIPVLSVDLPANEAIVKLRKGGSGLDAVETQQLKNTILVHPAANRVRERFEKMRRHHSGGDPNAVRKYLNDLVLSMCRDSSMPADIREICKLVGREVRASLQSPGASCSAARRHKILEKAKDTFRKTNGHGPNDEELVELTGMTEDQIREIRDWHRINYSTTPDAVDWQKRIRKPRIEDEEVHGLADDDDGPLGGILV